MPVAGQNPPVESVVEAVKISNSRQITTTQNRSVALGPARCGYIMSSKILLTIFPLAETQVTHPHKQVAKYVAAKIWPGWRGHPQVWTR